MREFKYTCSRCGAVHQGAPSFAYGAPYQYHCLSDSDKQECAELSEDFCVLTYMDQVDRFIRVVLEVPIEGSGEPFLWGVWISLSADNFRKYVDNFDSETYKDEYVGWFSNQLPYYPDTLVIRARALVTPGGDRPSLELEPTDHPLSVDYHNGISWDKAIEVAEAAMHGKPH